MDQNSRLTLKLDRKNFRFVYLEYLHDMEGYTGLGIEKYVDGKLMRAVRYAYHCKGPHKELGDPLMRLRPLFSGQPPHAIGRRNVDAVRQARRSYHEKMRARLR